MKTPRTLFFDICLTEEPFSVIKYSSLVLRDLAAEEISIQLVLSVFNDMLF